MALRFHNSRKARAAQKGMSLLEVLIAAFILIVGVLGVMGLVITAIGANSVSRQQSNSTAIAQMMMEKIMSVPANTNPTLSITDCAGNAHNISTAAGGATLLSSGMYSGAVDFSQASVANYSALYTTCGTSGRQIVYDVRWKIAAIAGTGNLKMVTVSAKQQNASSNPQLSAPEVTIKSMAGLGS